ncbi:FCD domain-containing protein [Sulfitobacter sp. F26204]|uniref:FadR/GntR family transcriptional regulator n=1 Tax=Sulfitobacter sp. F26204 TaxID=2996014 RepID=UPI00225E68A8|nr:FCD domain-containing protein [Sulfitobacter sp. F26204]MCX7560667.1 FCD domain-containing protein [Sulfitobacter sp. F26204]
MSTKLSGDEKDLELLKSLREGLASEAFLRDGRLIGERDLASKMDVSRARLRRALDQMEKDGDIFRRQGQGTFVLPPPLTHAPRVRSLAAAVTPHDVMEVRLEIEPALAALAAERATTKDLHQLESFCAATKSRPSAEAYERADDIFHYKIAKMAANPLFLSIFEEIRAVRREAVWTNVRAESYSPMVLAETSAQHDEICIAIASQNPHSAASAMQRHLVHVSNARLRPRWYDADQ